MHQLRTLFREPTEPLNLLEFRKKLRNRQRKANAARGNWSTWKEFNLSKHILSLPKFNAKKSIAVGLFSPRQDWDEPEQLPEVAQPHTSCYPRIHSEALSFHICNAEELEFNRDFGVWQAPDRCEELVPNLLIIPSSAVDLYGRRLGRGGGFYDRYLEQNPNVYSIGVLHSDYVFEKLPDDYFHSGDQKITSILTDKDFHFDLKEQI